MEPPQPDHGVFLTRFAQAITLLSHPVFVPIYLILFAMEPTEEKLPLFLIAFLLVSAFPLFTSWLYFKKQNIGNLFVIEKEHRVVPFIFNLIGICIFGAWVYLFGKELIPGHFILILLYFNILAFIITLFWKISLHLMGLGAILGIGFAYSFFPGEYLMLLLCLGVSILVAWARYFLGSHSPSQLVVAYVLSCLAALSLIFLN